MKLVYILFIPVLFIFIFSSHADAQQARPFLLVKPEQYAELQSRSLTAPYSSMKSDAITTCNTLQYNAGQTPCAGTSYNDTHCMRNIMSACALAYILEPANKQTYLQKMMQVFPRWEDIITIQSGADDGTRNTANEYYNIAGAAYFNSLLAIDIVYNDLQNQPFSGNASMYPGRTFTNQLEYAEFIMEQEFNHFYGNSKGVYDFVKRDGSLLFYNMPSRHPPAKEAALIIWKLYKGTFNASDPDSQKLMFGGTIDMLAMGGYVPETNARINESGVYAEGSSYALAGWGSDREERAHLIDVLEFTGKDAEFGLDFYTNPRWQTFIEWLYGYATTPFGMHVSFGDTYAYRLMSDQLGFGAVLTRSPRIAAAGKFGPAAGSYAIWKAAGQTPQGRLLQYLLYTPGTTVATPPSKVFANGGGFFLEQPATPQSLFGALWNVKPQEEGSLVFHVRKDVNALYVAGYGAPLLMNGGFCGSSSPAGPDSCIGQDPTNTNIRFPGEYLGDRAISNNVALLNYTIGDSYLTPNNDGNTSKFGNGIEEGFTGNGLDYASGSFSGFAQTSAKHTRNFLFKHPETGTRGYFIVFDELTGVSQGPVNLVFHPNASSRQVVTPLTEYNLPVGRRASADASTGLALFFGTPPSTIAFHPGIIASAGSIGGYVPEYFLNDYPLSGNAKQIVTILFPYNAANPKATMSRIQGNQFSGAIMTQGTITDIALEVSTTSPVTHDTITLQGKAAWIRREAGNVQQYFIRQGTSFSNNASSPTGYNANLPITIHLNGMRGNIVSPGTSVTFRLPGIQAVRLNNQTLNPSSSGNGFITATIPAGTHTLELQSPNTPPPTTNPTPTSDVDNDGDTDFFDLSRLISWFNQSNCSFNQLQSCVVDIFDINAVVKWFALR